MRKERDAVWIGRGPRKIDLVSRTSDADPAHFLMLNFLHFSVAR
jgi:hypothetical protein